MHYQLSILLTLSTNVLTGTLQRCQLCPCQLRGEERSSGGGQRHGPSTPQQNPQGGPQPANLMFELYEIGGLATLGLVVAFWLWSLVRRRETPFAALFPWLSSTRLQAVGADLSRHWGELKNLRLPGGEPETPQASAVHGLGLLTVLAMGASGAWLFTQTVPEGLVLEVHKITSNLMWAYIVAHAGLAVLHQIAGHRVLQRMFARSAGGARDAGDLALRCVALQQCLYGGALVGLQDIHSLAFPRGRLDQCPANRCRRRRR